MKQNNDINGSNEGILFGTQQTNKLSLDELKELYLGEWHNSIDDLQEVYKFAPERKAKTFLLDFLKKETSENEFKKLQKQTIPEIVKFIKDEFDKFDIEDFFKICIPTKLKEWFVKFYFPKRYDSKIKDTTLQKLELQLLNEESPLKITIETFANIVKQYNSLKKNPKYRDVILIFTDSEVSKAKLCSICEKDAEIAGKILKVKPTKFGLIFHRYYLEEYLSKLTRAGYRVGIVEEKKGLKGVDNWNVNLINGMDTENINEVLSGLGTLVYHNSPYLLKKADGSFIDPITKEKLGFDHRFMGNGEGNQAHGWGSYFSVKDLRSYGKKTSVSLAESTFNNFPTVDVLRNGLWHIEWKYLLSKAFSNTNALRYYIETYTADKDKRRFDKERKKILDYIDRGIIVFEVNNSHNYVVEIPDNDGFNYLEENEKPTDNQLNIIYKKLEENGINQDFIESIKKGLRYKINRTGRYIYQRISDIITPIANNYGMASKFLKKCGIVGIHYFGESDGECYVIFDENDAKIVKHELFGLGSLISEPTKQTFYENLYSQLESIVKDDSFEKNGIRNFILSHIPEDYKNDNIEGIVEVFYQRLRALKCGGKGLGDIELPSDIREVIDNTDIKCILEKEPHKRGSKIIKKHSILYRIEGDTLTCRSYYISEKIFNYLKNNRHIPCNPASIALYDYKVQNYNKLWDTISDITSYFIAIDEYWESLYLHYEDDDCRRKLLRQYTVYTTAEQYIEDAKQYALLREGRFHRDDLINYKGFEETIFKIVGFKGNNYIVVELGDRTRTKNEIPFADKDKLQRAVSPLLIEEMKLLQNEKKSLVKIGDEFIKPKENGDWLSMNPKRKYDFYYISHITSDGQICVYNEQNGITTIYKPEEFIKQDFEFYKHQKCGGKGLGVITTLQNPQLGNIVEELQPSGLSGFEDEFSKELLVAEMRLLKLERLKDFGEKIGGSAKDRYNGRKSKDNTENVQKTKGFNRLPTQDEMQSFGQACFHTKFKPNVSDFEDFGLNKIVARLCFFHYYGIFDKYAGYNVNSIKIIDILKEKKVQDAITSYFIENKRHIDKFGNKKINDFTTLAFNEYFFNGIAFYAIDFVYTALSMNLEKDLNDDFDYKNVLKAYNRGNKDWHYYRDKCIFLDKNKNDITEENKQRVFNLAYENAMNDFPLFRVMLTYNNGIIFIAHKDCKENQRTWRPLSYKYAKDLQQDICSAGWQEIYKHYAELYVKGKELYGQQFGFDEPDKWRFKDKEGLFAKVREGKDWRKGRNAEPKDFIDTFGFRAVEFGETMPQKERWEHLNRTFDSFMDLCDILNIKPENISLGGTLALSFGSRGRGGKHAAAAHYEPTKKVINLTRRSGAGCLAHEWFHAFDNQVCDSSSAFGSSGYGTEDWYNWITNMDNIEYFHKFKDGCSPFRNNFTFYMRSENLDNYEKRKEGYWSKPRECGARVFEWYIIEKLNEKGFVNEYLAQIPKPEPSHIHHYPYPDPDIPEDCEWLKYIFDGIFTNVKQIKTPTGVTIR